MNKQELDDRIERMLKVYLRDNLENFNIPGKQIDDYLRMHMPGYTKSQVRLIARDCIEAVTPGRSPKPPENIREHSFMLERNWVLDHIEANTKELLGDKQS